jgi:hypothetical protein
MEKILEFRWVRFGKRTHREGYVEVFSVEILDYLRRREGFHCGAVVNRKERFFASLRMTDHGINVRLSTLTVWWESPTLPGAWFLGYKAGL